MQREIFALAWGRDYAKSLIYTKSKFLPTEKADNRVIGRGQKIEDFQQTQNNIELHIIDLLIFYVLK
jgi:hypothetical protein